MTKERNPNLDTLLLAVEKLGELCDEMVFLGGCTTGLLITDQASPPVRETKDIDVIVEVTTRAEYYKLSESLRELGFKEDQSEGAPLCRWVMEGVILDVMPTDSEILGFSNIWYATAMKEAVEISLPNAKRIKVVTAPYFLATKLEAFAGRGNGDYLLSHDLEDLISVVDGRPEIIEEVRQTNEDVKTYLAEKFKLLLDDSRFIEALPGKVPGDESSQSRIPVIIERLEKLL
jgi:predicted nucleotidyltransferase